MSTPSLERHDLEQDIAELRSSITSLESSRSRLRDVLPAQGAAAAGSIWSDLGEIVTDFFQLAGEAVREDPEGSDENDGLIAKAEKTVRKAVTTDWSGALGAAFTRLSERVAADVGVHGSATPPTAELGDVLGELDAEIARLDTELRRKLDRAAELDRSLDSSDDVVPVRPHHREVTDDDRIVVLPDDHDVDVTPMPVDVLPDVRPVVVPDKDTDDVVPMPQVDVTPPIDVIPSPEVVTPQTDDDTTANDDAPAYVPGNATEIGELDGAIYDVNEILANGHTVADLRKYDVPAGVVLDAGVGASALLDGGYTLAELHEGGVSPADLHSLAGAADLRAAGYTAADLRGVFSAGELSGIYSVGELRSAGFDAAELNAGGVSWTELASGGFTLSDLENAGAAESSLREIFPHEFVRPDDSGE